MKGCVMCTAVESGSRVHPPGPRSKQSGKGERERERLVCTRTIRGIFALKGGLGAGFM